MQVKKGQKLKVNHDRHGRFVGMALEDFDTEGEEWYPIAACETVYGAATEWVEGEEVPCRKGLCSVELI